MSLLIGVPRETFPGEKRVATVPEVVEKLIKQGFRVAVEAGAGDLAQISDDAYRADRIAQRNHHHLKTGQRAPPRGVAIYTTTCGEQTAAGSHILSHEVGEGDRTPKPAPAG